MLGLVALDEVLPDVGADRARAAAAPPPAAPDDAEDASIVAMHAETADARRQRLAAAFERRFEEG